jgi:molybdopterin-containing oxidoreductase family iron-sulfur binding subunit
VDVDACIGCQACVVACHAENNVPDRRARPRPPTAGRCSWLRIERWAKGPAGHPHTGFLPMFCQHCEVAPCEPVCPVFAGLPHGRGLNGQVYNRCVGHAVLRQQLPVSRARFNWWNYEFPAPLEVSSIPT